MKRTDELYSISCFGPNSRRSTTTLTYEALWYHFFIQWVFDLRPVTKIITWLDRIFPPIVIDLGEGNCRVKRDIVLTTDLWLHNHSTSTYGE